VRELDQALAFVEAMLQRTTHGAAITNREELSQLKALLERALESSRRAAKKAHSRREKPPQGSAPFVPIVFPCTSFPHVPEGYLWRPPPPARADT